MDRWREAIGYRMAQTAAVTVTALSAPLLDAYLRRREDLRRLLAARAGAGEAEDLVQDLYLKVVALENQEAILDPDAFLFRLAYNLAADRRRGAQRRVARDDRWRQETTTLVAGVPVADAPAADVVAAARQEVSRMLAVVDGLPPRAREVFRLHKLDGLTYAEVAQRLRISVSAVEQHMHRALSELVRRRLR